MASESSAAAFASGFSPKPPPLPARRIVIDENLTKEGEEMTGVDHAEDELPEQRLRELYDDEEIDWFLNLFSACVMEVQLPGLPTTGGETSREEASILGDDPAVPVEEGDWIPVQGSFDALPSDISFPPPSSKRCFSEEIAFRYVVPILPQAPLRPPGFTLGRLRLTTQRLYLAIEPVYKPFFGHLAKLAIWQDKQQSSIYCTVFWILWYKNLLVPALFLRIFYSLIRHKVLPYPTVAELRKHRREIRWANEFGDEIQARLSVSSAFGMKEIWRLFKIFSQSNMAKAKNLAKEKAKGKEVIKSEKDNIVKGGIEGVTVLDDIKENQEEKDVKCTILHCLSEISDLHERIKNIFIWRRPVSSRIYGAVMFLLFLVTLLLPARYLVKLTYFIGGIFFWHITPIVVALPPADRARLPAPFKDAPTDADYAMELISRRVAAGLPVKPTSNWTENKKNPTRNTSGNSGVRDDSRTQSLVDNDQSVDWKKWGARAAIGKGWAGDGKRLVTGGQWPSFFILQQPTASAQSETYLEMHTFPAQHNAAPGLINLTPTTLSFTPMMSVTSKIIIPLRDLRGVKKTGMFKGLSIRWGETGSQLENEERFRWVGSRDELFARLIGADGRQWMKA